MHVGCPRFMYVCMQTQRYQTGKRSGTSEKTAATGVRAAGNRAYPAGLDGTKGYANEMNRGEMQLSAVPTRESVPDL